jgi:hypothetical protein
MKQLLILSLLCIGISVFGMQEPESDTQRKQILAYAKKRKEDHCDLHLLKIAHQTDPETLVNTMKNYYNFCQPKDQISVWAYLKKPIVNVYKVGAYLQLLRESSIYVRKEAEKLPDNQRESAPVDLQMFKRTKQLWPFVSIQYELLELANELDRIHHWTNKSLLNCKQENHEESQQELKTINDDCEAVQNAIKICRENCEN